MLVDGLSCSALSSWVIERSSNSLHITKVVLFVEDFDSIIKSITEKLDLLELNNITGTLDDVTAG